MKTNPVLIVAVCGCLCGMGIADDAGRLTPAEETKNEAAPPSISPEWKSRTIHNAVDGKLTYSLHNIDKIDVKVQRIPDDQAVDALRAYEFLFVSKNNEKAPPKLEKYLKNTHIKGGVTHLALESPTRAVILDGKGKKNAVLSLDELFGGKLDYGLYQVYAQGVFSLKNDRSPAAEFTQYRMYDMGGDDAFVPSTILVRATNLDVKQSVDSTGGLKITVSSRSTPDRKIEAKVQCLDEKGEDIGPETPAGNVIHQPDGAKPCFIRVTTPQETFIDRVLSP